MEPDPLGLRATEIKGLWRWWARAFVAGALFDLGYLRGQVGRDVLRRPTAREAQAISLAVGKLLGLGYAGVSGAEASRYRIAITPLNVGFEDPRGYGLQRLRLLGLGARRSFRVLKEGSEFEIRIARRGPGPGGLAGDAAVKILLVSLQLSGVGKGSRRGLGSLDVIDSRGDLGVGGGGVRSLIEGAYQDVRDLLERRAGELGIARAAGAVGHLPPLPSMGKASVMGEGISRVCLSSAGFDVVHNFFVRSERCRRLYGDPRCYDDLRRGYSAWFLGLPRSQRGSGYIIKSRDISRRASPILVACHSRENLFGGGCFISFLLSEDWPSEIEWREGSGSRVIRLNTTVIIDAFKAAYSEFERYLGSLGSSLGVVWP